MRGRIRPPPSAAVPYVAAYGKITKKLTTLKLKVNDTDDMPEHRTLSTCLRALKMALLDPAVC